MMIIAVKSLPGVQLVGEQCEKQRRKKIREARQEVVLSLPLAVLLLIFSLAIIPLHPKGLCSDIHDYSTC